MARKDLKKSINSSIRLKNDSEVVDEARAMHRKLITIEKNLKNEEEALEFEREKIKNPEISAYLAKKTLQNDPKYLNSFEKNSLRQKIEYKDGASQNIMKDFNSDLAYVTKLKKIDRENTIVENVKHLHFNYKVDKLKKKSNFKQNEVFENDSKKFHFLTTTKAFESSKVDKFQRNSDYLYSTGSLFHKTPKHQRAQTSYRIKPVNICKQSSEHVKMLLKIAENKINSCKSESLMQRYQTETPFSLQNNDYSVLFTYDNSKDL